ncbi:MAG: hypothetical protein KKG60_00775 [Nanoarchaeota archaeon]|nr:hypothetical protein [Nanoarchaeota archaeon]
MVKKKKSKKEYYILGLEVPKKAISEESEERLEDWDIETVEFKRSSIEESVNPLFSFLYHDYDHKSRVREVFTYSIEKMDINACYLKGRTERKYIHLRGHREFLTIDDFLGVLNKNKSVNVIIKGGTFDVRIDEVKAINFFYNGD